MNRKKVAWLLTVGLLVGVLAACSNQSGGDENSNESITFSWLVYDRPEGKVRTDWEIFKEIKEKTGVSIEFNIVSQEGLTEKKQIMIATNTPTDFINVSMQDAREHGPENIFLNLKQYFDRAPNLKKFFDENAEARAVATGADGGIYAVPVLEGDVEGKGFNFVWYIRKDLMDKYHLQAPKTLDEFYELLKAFKQREPDTYPLTANAIVGDTGLYTTFGRAFTGIHGFFNLDPETDTYAFAPYHDGYKEMLVFLNKLYAEKLLDPEFSLITQAQWEERMLTGKSVVTYFWKADMETIIDKARQAGNAEYDLDVIPMFAADGIKPYQFSRPVIGGSGLAIAAKVKDKERAVKFLDYLKSEEGTNYLSLGIEGKTYMIEDGKPVFNPEFGTSPFTVLRKDWGVWYDQITLNNALSREVWERGLSEKSKDINARYAEFIVPAPKQIVKTDEELELEKSKLNNLNKYLEQKVTEFVTGKTPINDSTYQEFINQAKKLGSDELLEMYNTAYKRTYGK